jgi:voltage-gated potassium channel
MEKPGMHRPLLGRLRYMATPLALVDLAAVLPFYLPMLIPLDLRFVRMLRLFRIVWLFKLGRYSDSLQLLGKVLKSKKEELTVAVFAVITMLVFASFIMYFVEGEANPGMFSSVPAAMWWAAATLSTVGYGDVVPITALGKVVSGFIELLGIGLFALPAGILASGFNEEMRKRRAGKEKRVCPHCGKPIEGRDTE